MQMCRAIACFNDASPYKVDDNYCVTCADELRACSPSHLDLRTAPSGCAPAELPKKHNHYFKDTTHLTCIDIYRILDLYEVTDPCLGHAVKKILCAGQRGAKDIGKDIQEAIDTLQRWQTMRAEDARTAV